MKKIHKFYLIGVLTGLFLGMAAHTIVTRLAKSLPTVYVSTTDWRAQAEGVRDAWLKDRQDWRNGKPFEVHYGPHHHTW